MEIVKYLRWEFYLGFEVCWSVEIGVVNKCCLCFFGYFSSFRLSKGERGFVVKSKSVEFSVKVFGKDY